MSWKLFFAVLAAVAAGTVFYFLRHGSPVPAVPQPVPVSNGLDPLPPDAKVMPRIEPVFEKIETIDLEKERDPRLYDFFHQTSTYAVYGGTSTK